MEGESESESRRADGQTRVFWVPTRISDPVVIYPLSSVLTVHGRRQRDAVATTPHHELCIFELDLDWTWDA